MGHLLIRVGTNCIRWAESISWVNAASSSKVKPRQTDEYNWMKSKGGDVSAEENRCLWEGTQLSTSQFTPSLLFPSYNFLLEKNNRCLYSKTLQLSYTGKIALCIFLFSTARQ